MDDQFTRLRWVAGNESIDIMKTKHVAVFGCGGVGGYVIEGLVRSGIGTIDVFDHDTVDITNLNRQIIALHSTVGKKKVDIIKERMLDINPNLNINTFDTFYLPENADTIDLSQYDYVIDAIDTVVGKLSLIEKAKEANTPIICAMGAGNKMDPTKFEVADISETSVCPLARVIRTELRKRKIKGVKVVYSKETPITPQEDMSISCKAHCVCPPGTRKCTVKHQIPGSNAFVPPVVGLIIAGEVIKDLIGYNA